MQSYFIRWGRICRLAAVMALAVITIGSGIARADLSWTQTGQADFESGTLFQVDTSSSPGDLKLARAGCNYLYALKGNNTRGFLRYDISANSWTSRADAPANVKWGGALGGDGVNYVYAFRGNNTRSFWRYNISLNNWASLADAPANVKWGGALTYNGGNYIYALQGNDTRSFWRYDIAANSWVSLANTIDPVTGGGALICDGGDYIYAFQGGSTGSFWRYDISADSWSLMASTPDSAGNGAALACDGSGYIYALSGAFSQGFWRYNIADNTWSIMAGTPSGVEWGGALVFNGGKIYALRGNNSTDFWRYDIPTGSWSSKASTPCPVGAGGALAPGRNNYNESGTLTSCAYDTGLSSDFGSISWTASTPPGTAVKFQIATNSDNSTWDFKGPDGTATTCYTSSGSIWSGHDGDSYIKYRAFLNTADTAVTPVLHEVTIIYNPQVGLPAASTAGATLVEETTATIHGSVLDDGGEACQYRFEYGTTPGSYTADTGWTGSVVTGESFSADVTGLGKGTPYYYRAQVRNSAGTGIGPEVHFLTKPDPPLASSFLATPVSDTQIDLSWAKGEGAQRTMIRRGTGDYPADIEEGVLVYFGEGTGASDIGLSPSTLYYYSAWSEVTGSQQWSDSFKAVAVTTGFTPPTVVGGIVFPANKAQILAPWVSIALALSLALGRIIFHLRKSA